LDIKDKIYVAGHRGMVGSAIVRSLLRSNYRNLVLRTRDELDLTDNEAVRHFFDEERPAYVFIAAARVGGILANFRYPVEFLSDNIRINNNLITAAKDFNAEKLLFMGSSCIYPKFAAQPIKENALLTGPLEPTNEGYALAKIAGIRLCQYMMSEYGKRFISVMPTNLYGPNDNYDLDSGHVLPAMIRRFHSARVAHAPTVTLWGSGAPMREMMHADDLADACLFLMNHYEEYDHINAGTGEDMTIRELARIVQHVVGFEGETIWDTSKPDGTPRKVMDVTRIQALGWHHTIDLEEGIRRVYNEVDKTGWAAA